MSEKIFVDLHVHSINSKGIDTPKRLLYHANQLGIKIGLCDGIKYADIDVFSGIEIHAEDKRDLKVKLREARNNFDYIIANVHGTELRRIAVENCADILSHGEIDTYIARKARENNVAIEINLSKLINAEPQRRILVLRHIKTVLMLSNKYKFDIIVTSGAHNRYDLRAFREVYELLRTIGFSEEKALNALYTVPLKIIDRNRKYIHIFRGVRIVRQ